MSKKSVSVMWRGGEVDTIFGFEREADALQWIKEKSQGYDLTPTGDGERIVATAITERFCMRAVGVLEPLTSGLHPTGRADRDACRHLQGEAVCLEHILNAVPRSAFTATLLARICSAMRRSRLGVRIWGR